MTIRVGTSGYAFKEWKGPFYPADVHDDSMLGFYSTRFPTVEINNTFYRLPKEKVILDWGAQVPETFRFALKASQRITHFARLKPECADTVAFLLKNTSSLGDRLGPILFQLPPNMQKNVERLRTFLDLLPNDRRFTIEFRHESWFDEDVFTALRERDIPLCIAEQEDFKSPEMVTASWGYLRLHRQDYTNEMLVEWASRVSGQAWTDAYVFFKHDHVEGSGPWAVDRFVSALIAGGVIPTGASGSERSSG
jgi:uncharacterized protein YecE (DUF72 family)